MTTIECPAEMDIAVASTLHRQLLQALQAGDVLEIDGQAVKRIHAAVLQIFLSVVIAAHAANLQVHWRNPSTALLESARLLGLTDALGLETAN